MQIFNCLLNTGIRGFLLFAHISLCSSVYVCLAPGQTKNDGDLKFGTHDPRTYLEDVFLSKKWH